jgi:hypothetical protein
MIWEFLKKNFLSNRVFENFQDILQAYCNAWNALIKDPDRIGPSGQETGIRHSLKIMGNGIRLIRVLEAKKHDIKSDN